MNAKELLADINVLNAAAYGMKGIDIKAVASDSRDIKAGSVFVAVRGAAQDGHRFIQDAVDKNASAIVLEDANFLPRSKAPVPFILVKDSKDALVKIAGAFFGHPYRGIKCIGITGTNGKTTTSYLARGILNAAGQKCALIGTIGYKIKDTNVPSSNTTPGVLELHELAREMALAGNKYIAMEVSSHAIHQDRIAGMAFRAAIFTNLTQDHLDYHKDMEEYFSVKRRLFCDYAAPDSSLIINTDDCFGMRLYKDVRGKKISYGYGESDVRVERDVIEKSGSSARINTPAGSIDITTSLVGRHNIYNILAAVALGLSEGVGLDVIRRGVESVGFVPGRLERIDSTRGFSVFIDYAHTDDALKNVLESLRSILHNGRIITVFGCGGDRDKSKRPKMGAVAAALSDHCILTSDNPRSEEPSDIISHIASGIVTKNFEVEIERMSAIRRAVKMAKGNDLVLVAGKGHETYQIVKDKISAFDDKEAVLECLREMEAHV
ncbi:MAG TPA: UDP-N-acetylmuramoyl-L-alanyl-D-glutamate--2,6-diaminopimelate ligase [Candidatus Omnitrophica bacterium]|nr:UDP-N-acetylmuramoyl-L-alanyl-D-glutamate--2,6-diaminopimelate ligase [Candidatus Omnitrophota bacterium]